MNVLVTGASGFVGRYLCQLLHEAGHVVFPVVRDKSKMLKGIPVACHRIIPDMGPSTDWVEALADIDIIINLAARVHVMSDNSENPLDDFRRVNVDGTLNLARQADRAGVIQFIHISSIKVNGEQTFGSPYRADSVPSPGDAYGVSKLEAEQALFHLAMSSKLAVTVIRPPLVYGRNVKGNLEVLIKALQKGLPLPLAIIRNKRDMVSLYNLCDLIRICIGNEKSYGRVFLVSDGQSISTSELVSYLAAGMGKPCRSLPVPPILLKMVFGILGKADMAGRLLGDLEVDISFTRKEMNWNPPFTVEQSFRKMFAESR